MGPNKMLFFSAMILSAAAIPIEKDPADKKSPKFNDWVAQLNPLMREALLKSLQNGDPDPPFGFKANLTAEEMMEATGGNPEDTDDREFFWGGWPGFGWGNPSLILEPDGPPPFASAAAFAGGESGAAAAAAAADAGGLTGAAAVAATAVARNLRRLFTRDQLMDSVLGTPGLMERLRGPPLGPRVLPLDPSTANFARPPPPLGLGPLIPAVERMDPFPASAPASASASASASAPAFQPASYSPINADEATPQNKMAAPVRKAAPAGKGASSRFMLRKFAPARNDFFGSRGTRQARGFPSGGNRLRLTMVVSPKAWMNPFLNRWG